jgi:hypothetical protein
MKTVISLGVLLLSVAASTAAQTVRPIKPYSEWTRDDVIRILFNSQWTRDSIQVNPPVRYNPNSPDTPPGTNYSVRVLLYSALPVRQAIARRMQLTIPYEKLTSAQRVSFDAEMDGLLKCPQCAEYYIVTVGSATKDRLDLISRGGNVMLDVVERLKEVPEDELLRHVSLLNDKGERRNAARIVFTQKHEVVFLFRRSDDSGNLLITASNKKFYVDFDKYLSTKTEEALKKFTFNVGDLVHDGDVVF